MFSVEMWAYTYFPGYTCYMRFVFYVYVHDYADNAVYHQIIYQPVDKQYLLNNKCSPALPVIAYRTSMDFIPF